MTIAEAAASHNPRISSQIPPSLRESRTLILCPASLVQNWQAELTKWTNYETRRLIGPLCYLVSEVPPKRRAEEIRRWHEEGGLLVLSYELFRNCCQNNEVGEIVTSGPNIIIADEAHRLRNEASGTSRSVKSFRSRSRIALTGTPLNNDMQEIYAMINWIAPQLLGRRIDFLNRFAHPIQAGLYVESTPQMRQHSEEKLQRLMQLIGTKVDRKDIAVIQNEMPRKTEFVLKVPLTGFQTTAYRLITRSLMHRMNDVSTTGESNELRVFGWLAGLSLLCNHPHSFKSKLPVAKIKKKVSKEAQAISVKAGQELNFGDVSQHVGALGIDSGTVYNLEELFKTIRPKQLESAVQSNKVALLLMIIDYCKSAQEKVLVFTQHIPTVSYLKDLFNKRGFQFTCIEGAVQINARATRVEQFNSGIFDVIIVSTRAGGEGINLTGGSRVILFDSSFNPMWEQQAIARAFRLGQQKDVFVYSLIAAGTFEEAMYERTSFKTQLASRVIDRKVVARSASKAQELLFEPRQTENKALGGYFGMDLKVLDRVLKRSGCPISDILRPDIFPAQEETTRVASEMQEIAEGFMDQLKLGPSAADEKEKQKRAGEVNKGTKIVIKTGKQAGKQAEAQQQAPQQTQLGTKTNDSAKKQAEAQPGATTSADRETVQDIFREIEEFARQSYEDEASRPVSD